MNGVLLLQLIKRDILSFFPLPRTPADIRIGEIEIPLILHITVWQSIIFVIFFLKQREDILKN